MFSAVFAITHGMRWVTLGFLRSQLRPEPTQRSESGALPLYILSGSGFTPSLSEIL